MQDDLAYVAYWDAGVIVLAVADPSEPELIAQFGAAPESEERMPPLDIAAGPEEFLAVFPTERFYGLPRNVHYVEPSPDGDDLYAGAETFIGDAGGIDVWDITDLDYPETVAQIDAPPGGEEIEPEPELDPEDRDVLLRIHTAHNFDVLEERLYSAWYGGGGIRVHDISDPTSPAEIASFQHEDGTFWSALSEDGLTIASDINRGIVVLQQT